MGLGIAVGEKTFYMHPYHELHVFRGFAAQKERPELAGKPLFDASDRPTFYNQTYNRFKALIIHSAAEGGYVPSGVELPNLEGVAHDEIHWQSSEELLKELGDLAQYRDEMDEDSQIILDELTAAAEASVRLKLPVVFF